MAAGSRYMILISPNLFRRQSRGCVIRAVQALQILEGLPPSDEIVRLELAMSMNTRHPPSPNRVTRTLGILAVRGSTQVLAENVRRQPAVGGDTRLRRGLSQAPGTATRMPPLPGTLALRSRKPENAFFNSMKDLLCAPTAFGKTAVAAWLIGERKVNTLVLVHRGQLLDQWRERLASFLNVPVESIGQIGGGKEQITGRIDVAMIQSTGKER